MTFSYRPRPGWVCFSVVWDKAGNVIERKWRPKDRAESEPAARAEPATKIVRGIAVETQGSLL